MVEDNAVEALLVADAVGPIFVCGFWDGHGEDVGGEVGAGRCVGVGGGEGDGGHGFGGERLMDGWYGIGGCDWLRGLMEEVRELVLVVGVWLISAMHRSTKS